MGNKIFQTTSLACLLFASACVPQAETAKSKLLTEGTTKSSDLVQPLTVPNNVAPTPDVGVSKVAVGAQHACAIQSGKLSCWGLNKNGQIGNGDSGVVDGVPDSLTGSSYTVKVVLSPTVVFPSDVSDIAVGFEHSCAIRNEELFCWGSNENSQLGINPVPADPNAISFSRPVSILRNVKQVAARGRWTCAVTTSGQLLCFGTRLAVSTVGPVPRLISKTPRVILASGVTSVALSANHACVLVSGGGVKCFGMNAMGEVGASDSNPEVMNPTDVFTDGVTSLTASDGRTCMIRLGQMFCAGASLGDRAIDATAGGWKVASPTPYVSAFWNPYINPVKISSSGTIITSSGDLLYGSYFHATGTAQKIAIGVIDFGFSEADQGGCMMFRNHSVKCWGPNLFGQLGNGRRSTEEPAISKSQDAKVQ